MASSTTYSRPDPLNVLLPLLVTRLTETPLDCTDASLPPVWIWISSKASKSKYIDEDDEAMSVMLPPSTFQTSLLPVPCATNVVCWPDLLPPTFWPDMMMPGVCSMTTHGSRADGMRSSSSRVNVWPVVVDRVSITGLAAVTVIVSCTAETASWAFTSALKPVSMRMPSRTTRVKPASSKVTL